MNIKRLEKQQKTQKEKKVQEIDRKQKLLSEYILTRPRAPHPAPSAGNNTKEGSNSKLVGRGEGAKVEEGKGDRKSLGKRQDPRRRSQETCPSTGRARLVSSEKAEGTQVSKEGREGVKDISKEEGRPGQEEGKGEIEVE